MRESRSISLYLAISGYRCFYGSKRVHGVTLTFARLVRKVSPILSNSEHLVVSERGGFTLARIHFAYQTIYPLL